MTLFSTFSLFQLLHASAVVKRNPPASGGKTAPPTQIGMIGLLEIVPAAQFGRIFGATPPLSGGKAGFIALIAPSTVEMEEDGDAVKAGDELVSGGNTYAVIGKPALWMESLLAVDLNLAVG